MTAHSRDAVVVDCIRTPMGRSKNGVFRNIRAEDLSACVMQALLKRNPSLKPEAIDDIYWGCVQQTLEQGYNIGRNAALLAGLPRSVPAVTINRLCGSSMQALHDASRAIQVGDADICLIGGVEHMGHIPMTHGVDIHPGLSKTVAKAAASMGMTAEMLAMKYQVSREEQDKFAARSHHRAHAATVEGRFQREIVPVEGHDTDGTLVLQENDEVIRPETSFESLSSLRPVFNPANGTVTAGSSSALSDGASAMLVMSRKKAEELGMPIRAKVRSMAVAGCEPSVMGIGPVPATHKALKKAGLNLADIQLAELNEAFAAQSLAVMKELGMSQDDIDNKVNMNGGAIALGHPLGCSGSRICTTLINQMEVDECQFGLATMCIGLGQGIATIFER